VPLSDLSAGVFAALGVLAALNHRHNTGEGQYVETSLLETALASTVWETGMHLTTGAVAQPAGSRHRLAAPYEALKTADGFLVVGVTTNRLWERFCEALGDESLAGDPCFDQPHKRVEAREALQARLETILATGSTDAWVERILAKGVPCGPLNTIDKALADPQIAARGMLVEVDGRRFTRTPLTMSKTPVSVRRGPAAIGQHTREVLAEAGRSTLEIDELAANGAILTPEAAQ
jgi:formyl-CoA transferase